MTARSRLVFRLVVPTGTAGATSTRYVTTRGFRTLATDTPASTYIEERVAKAGGYSKSLFSGGAVTGPIKPNYGVLTLNNEDGGLDTIATYAGGGGTVTCWWGEDGGAFPGDYTQVYTATIASVLVDFDTVTIRQQDRFEALNRPIVTATFDGSGGLEGTDTAARPKQLVFGSPGLIPLVLIDKALQLYYIQANATDLDTVRGLAEFGLMFEGGVPITRATPYIWSYEVTGTDSGPDPGTFKLWASYGGAFSINGATFGSVVDAMAYTKGPLFVRLGGVPVGELRFGARGLLQNLSSVPAREWRFSDLCNRAGLSDVSTATMATMQGSLQDFTAGNHLIDGEQTYAQLMADRCQALLGACGFDRLDRFFCLQLADPEDGDDASAYSFTADNSTDFRRLPVPGMERPVWQVNVKAGRSFPCSVFDGASAEMHDLLTRQGHYVSFRGFSTNVRQRYQNALQIDLQIDGHDFPTTTEQVEFVSRFGRLFGTRRDLMTLRCMQFDATTLTLDLHDKVTLTLDRLGYDAGVLMRIVGIELDLDAMTIRYSLWGGNTGYESWATTGGAFPADAGEPGGSWGGEDPPPDLVEATAATIGVAQQMGDFTGVIVGGVSVVPVGAGAGTLAAAMGDFEGAIIGHADGSGWANVVLLLHMEGADGSTTITDSSSFARTGTGGDTFKLSTTRAKFGSSSLKVTRYNQVGVQFGSHADFGLTAGESFTMEAWVYAVTTEDFTAAPVVIRWERGVSVERDSMNLYGITPGATIDTEVFGDQMTAYTMSKNVWVHLATTFDGTTEKLWIDGIQRGSFARTINTSTTGVIYIGGSGSGSGSATSTEVYIDEVRVTRGLCRYTGTFTPPTEAFPEG